MREQERKQRGRDITSTLVETQALMFSIVVTVITIGSGIKPAQLTLIKVDIFIDAIVLLLGMFSGILYLYYEKIWYYYICVVFFGGGTLWLLKIFGTILFSIV